MRKFLALSLALCMSMVFSTVAFATEPTVLPDSENVNYMDYDFPSDAVVLYQSEDGVIYQSNEEKSSTDTPSTRATVYESVWIDAGEHKTGNFSIENPHTIVNTTNGKFRIESDYANATAQMVLHDGIFTLANETLKASDGDVHIEFNSHSKNLVITYYVQRTSTYDGMRLMCWLW